MANKVGGDNRQKTLPSASFDNTNWNENKADASTSQQARENASNGSWNENKADASTDITENPE